MPFEPSTDPGAAPPAPSGHRLASHTADCFIEAWGPDQATCTEEALAALVEVFASVDDAPVTRVLPLGTDAGQPEDMLVALLEDVIYTVEVLAVVPVRFHLAGTEDGGLAGEMEVVPVEQVVATGPAPKAVSYHRLSMELREGRWQCQALIDV